MVVALIASTCILPFAKADESTPEQVPAPWIQETHEFNVSHTGGGEQGGYYTHEGWGIQVSHGGSKMAISVRTINNGLQPSEDTFIDYVNIIEYSIGGRRYSAQFYIYDMLSFEIGGFGGVGPSTGLSHCSGFELNRTPILYDDDVPTFYCNISFYNIRIYSVEPGPAGSEDSTYDLTLAHHIRGDWNNTQMKVEAIMNFSNTKLFNPINGTECPAGTPFTADLNYRISVAEILGNQTGDPLKPTGRTNKTLIFDLPQNNGTTLSVSRLDMKDNFTMHNATGDHQSVGSSFMGESNDMFTPVTHVFPNLIYKDTQWMRSDPKVTVYHDRITEENNQNPWATGPGAADMAIVAAVCAAIAIAAIIAVVNFRKKKKNTQVLEDEQNPKKS